VNDVNEGPFDRLDDVICEVANHVTDVIVVSSRVDDQGQGDLSGAVGAAALARARPAPSGRVDFDAPPDAAGASASRPVSAWRRC
jgi:hypothetical protein